ncbi:PREDICTED: aspartic proteinase CDR1-like [Lupinus angustifolius]|uniref:aspartic proteinase CDR1-like n=1 Tax=Lupinus angustifolius TaxID=3871 RepID=UPI00092F9A55|nr:PREDICTED: aspartic proteinase CDR1-like [Lupinus angustifolius]
MEKLYSAVVFVFLCLSGISLIEALGFGVELIHRESSTSPFYLYSETHFQRVANAIRRSINRPNYLKQSSLSPNSIESDVFPNQGEYLMSYSIGTPPVKTLGIVDTGSNVIWLQCQPCHPCYKQTFPIFNPSKSKTYKFLPCISNICELTRDTSCSSDRRKSCQYIIRYGDNSTSQGDLSLDTFTLSSTNGSSIQLRNTVIGCGHSNTLVFQGDGSGIVGIGNGPASLITQLGSSIKGKFSYCLLPLFTNSKFSSKLIFGDDKNAFSSKGSVSTPIVPDADFYRLNLLSFTVGDTKIEFESSSDGNIIIDSGTTLTLLPPDVYSKLESAVASAIPSEPIEDPSGTLSLCYKTSKNLDIPIITANFDGADVKLTALNTFIEISEGVTCFSFIPSIISIFGNLAQQNFLIGYDVKNQLLTFKPTDCSKQ